MVFLGVYKALYPWTESDDGMLPMEQGDLLCIVGMNEGSDWWRAKKKAVADEDDEPEGFVPSNYIEPAPVLGHAHTIYEYTRQTDEELSFSEDVVLQIFDTSDPDWILAGLDGDFGFVPSNYIEMQAIVTDEVTPPPSPDAPPILPARPQSVITEAERERKPEAEPEQQKEVRSPKSGSRGPAGALAGVLQSRQNSVQTLRQPHHERSVSARDDDYENDNGSLSSPALPDRPQPSVDNGSNSREARPCNQPNSHNPQPGEEPLRTPGGFHMYNISEMVSVMGKRKKMPTTLGINLKTGTILIAPEHAQDDPPQEWTSDKMRHYSREGKHVFLELVRPSKSIDFHAGARDTAEEIMGALSDLAGVLRAEGLREAILSVDSVRKGQVLYDFMAQGDDEVTVAAGDQVLVLDNSKSDEWWQVRRVKNGRQGVVPSSYIELTKTSSPTPTPGVSQSTINSARSTVEQNRLEEIRLTKAAIKANREPQQQQRSRRGSSRSDSRSKAKPDSAKVRAWTDRSGAFSVDAQFLGLRDGKIHLHKLNGVKIAVPIAKMSQADLEYVEQTTGMSLDDDKPLADVKRAKSTTKSAKVGATVGRSDKVEPEYDWFQFFLSCDVAVGLCERYAQAFTRDSMDESVLPDVNVSVLRTLGLREGDILKVMRHLDAKFNRDRSSTARAEDDNAAGGLFSGPGGALRNNTRKGRPAPTVQTNDVVDAAALSASSVAKNGSMELAVSPVKASAGGFDDDAWEVKTPQSSSSESKRQQNQPVYSGALKPQASTMVAETPLIGSMKDLSLLTQPLQPTKVEAQPTAVSLGSSQGPVEQGQQPLQQLAGASPSFFSSMPPLPTTSPQSLQPLARNRPPPPLSSGMSPGLGSLPPPPPTQRSLPAPQSAQQTVFSAATMTPQMTSSLQSQVAPPGQSLNDLSNARMQQQYAVQMQQMQPVVSGYGGMQPQSIIGFPTGQPMMQQPMMTGMSGASPFADPVRQSQFSPVQAQPTGFQQSQFPQAMAMPSYGMQHSQATGAINNFLPPALEPQRTGAPPLIPQPLLPQRTGPPPPVRFGMPAEAKKLASQQTGRRANLAQATPDNPFGF
ncbi:hypothetical protein CDD82_289 [Ophiocordyceps australis]|uniref:Actin cytoskeleton-regulatory complex protein SLA1 n=1 Tax=Ophiocordyceps australis TaxID=1399860 RepID=A0A2C5XS99_9HYPO|nr:hypothetical protein CDD82_289 [Ophiocordyceps australis]